MKAITKKIELHVKTVTMKRKKTEKKQINPKSTTNN